MNLIFWIIVVSITIIITFVELIISLFLKSAATFLLIFLVSFAYNFEAIEYFSKVIGGTSISWMNDFDCAEKKSETEESNEKNEKLKFSEDMYLHGNNQNAFNTEFGRLHSKHNINFSSSDYSQVVYSPPEVL